MSYLSPSADWCFGYGPLCTAFGSAISSSWPDWTIDWNLTQSGLVSRLSGLAEEVKRYALMSSSVGLVRAGSFAASRDYLVFASRNILLKLYVG